MSPKQKGRSSLALGISGKTLQNWQQILNHIADARDLEVRLLRENAPATEWFAVDFYKVDKWMGNAGTSDAK